MGADTKYSELEEGYGAAHYLNEETHDVGTPYGDIRVSVEPGCDLKKQKDLPVILTYHDMATNHQTCFGSFFGLEECQVFKELFCIVHIDCPGHEEGCKEVKPKLSLDELGEQVGCVIKHFGWNEGYGKVYAMGVGAGCSVLLNHAIKGTNQKVFKGVCLVNGSGSKAGWREWVWHKMVTNTLWLQGMSDRAKRAFLTRMYTHESIDANEDLVEEYGSALMKMVPQNVTNFMDAYIARPDISDELDYISCFDALHFAGGDNADFLWHVKELNKMFPLGQSTFLNIRECAMLVTEEGPHHMANPIKYWLAGKGFVMTALDMRQNRAVGEM
eukprot:TRINITY_DN1121_c1_g1_i2.p1 TRINITY_DN1121_c1_g1~~TRINITY_DN1121_c1_g1_i2.p1  ORF type:complete len:329 (+),score=100.75 TRINITY_DN1121_c1_g1_i2:56-1042(+)